MKNDNKPSKEELCKCEHSMFDDCSSVDCRCLLTHEFKVVEGKQAQKIKQEFDAMWEDAKPLFPEATDESKSQSLEDWRAKLLQECKWTPLDVTRLFADRTLIFVDKLLASAIEEERKKNIAAIDSLIIKRKPGHGSCCTCQSCGGPNDEICDCPFNEILEKAKQKILNPNLKKDGN